MQSCELPLKVSVVLVPKFPPSELIIPGVHQFAAGFRPAWAGIAARLAENDGAHFERDLSLLFKSHLLQY